MAGRNTTYPVDWSRTGDTIRDVHDTTLAIMCCLPCALCGDEIGPSDLLPDGNKHLGAASRDSPPGACSRGRLLLPAGVDGRSRTGSRQGKGRGLGCRNRGCEEGVAIGELCRQPRRRVCPDLGHGGQLQGKLGGSEARERKQKRGGRGDRAPFPASSRDRSRQKAGSTYRGVSGYLCDRDERGVR